MRKKKSTARKVPVLKVLVPTYVCLAILFVLLIRHGRLQLLEPAGYIAHIQSNLLWGAIIFAVILGFTLIGTFFTVIYRFREGSHKTYDPDWTGGKAVPVLSWGIPICAITVLSVLVWGTAHQVDPYQPIASPVMPITIQVVALQWKWLFIYPQDHIATVNFMEIPIGTPINLRLTADAPMNSFWVPRLSGQVYAMTGMVTQLHIEADRPGTYDGSSGEISGADFAGMEFSVKAVPASDYASWKSTVQSSSRALDYTAYKQLAEPSGYSTQALYSVPDPNLFDVIVMQFMLPSAAGPAAQDKKGTAGQ